MAINFYTPKFYVFNIFSAHAVEFNNVLYPTSEHAYQATKCLSPEGKEAIRLARSPRESKEIANIRYRAYRDPDWNEKKLAVMEEILRAKLSQHPEAMEALRQSGTDEIAEDSPVDYFWGTGSDGSGRNELGKLWMKLRAELQ